MLSERDIVLDSIVMTAFASGRWVVEFYVNSITNLKPGLTEMTVHLGHEDA